LNRLFLNSFFADITETAKLINQTLLKLISTEEDFIPDANGDKVSVSTSILTIATFQK